MSTKPNCRRKYIFQNFFIFCSFQEAQAERAKASSSPEHSTPAKKIVGSLFGTDTTKNDLKNLEEELLAHKIRETEVEAEASFLKQRIMELEAQVCVC
jgi:hypothetical protein